VQRTLQVNISVTVLQWNCLVRNAVYYVCVKYSLVYNVTTIINVIKTNIFVFIIEFCVCDNVIFYELLTFAFSILKLFIKETKKIVFSCILLNHCGWLWNSTIIV